MILKNLLYISKQARVTIPKQKNREQKLKFNFGRGTDRDADRQETKFWCRQTLASHTFLARLASLCSPQGQIQAPKAKAIMQIVVRFQQ